MASAGKFGSKWGSNCHKSNGQLLPHFQGVVTIQDDASTWWLPLPAPVWHFTQLVSQASHQLLKTQNHFKDLKKQFINQSILTSHFRKSYEMASTSASTSLNLRDVLNQLLQRPQPAPTGIAGRPGKSGEDQIKDNARDILGKSIIQTNQPAEVLGLGPCMISTASLDGRGRPVRSMRVTANEQAAIKREFRAYHVTWVAEFGVIPDITLQYSHRCHNELCVNPKHAVWESDLENKSRNMCRQHSHLRLPNAATIRLCPHLLPCISPAPDIDDWQDERVLVPPTAPPIPSSSPWPSSIPDTYMSESSPPPTPPAPETEVVDLTGEDMVE